MDLCRKCANLEHAVFSDGQEFRKCGYFGIKLTGGKTATECTEFVTHSFNDLFKHELFKYKIKEYLEGDSSKPYLINIGNDGKIGFKKGKKPVF